MKEKLTMLQKAVAIKLERIKEINDKLQVILSSLTEEEEKEIQSRLRRYAEAKGESLPFQKNTELDWEINGPKIYASWEEFWGGGGHDYNSFSVPLEFFMDDGTLLTQFEANCKIEKEAKEKEEKEKARQRKLSQLEQLKKELNEA